MADKYEELFELIKESNRLAGESLKLAAEAKEENIAMMAVCGALIGELALKHPNPRTEVDRICTSLRGVSEGVAKGTGGASKAHTNAIETITHVAEIGLEHLKRE